MSLHKEVDGDGGVVPGTLQSGAFTADVTLTATFGTFPLLGGYINGFKGNAVDPDWRVTLVEGAFTAAALADPTTLVWARRRPPVRTACGRRQAMAKQINARRVSSAASTPTSRTAMLPGRTPLGNSSNRNGVQNPVSSKGRPFVPPFFFRTVWRWTSRDAQNVLGRFWLEALECLRSLQ